MTAIVTPAAHPEGMGKSRHRPGPKVKVVQPGWRHRAAEAPPTAAQRAARLGPAQVLEKITRARIARDEAEAELAALIDRAVTVGVSWPEIARRLGVSRQAARQHYQRRHRGGGVRGRQDDAA
jgi:hypothetical protein